MVAQAANTGTQLRSPAELVSDRIVRFITTQNGFELDHGDPTSMRQYRYYRRIARELARGLAPVVNVVLNDIPCQIHRLAGLGSDNFTFVVRRADGNCRILSEETEHLAALIEDLIASNFDPDDD